MASANLVQNASVQLDGSGNGTVGTGPLSAREVWLPAYVHVQVSSDNLEAVCNIYVGDSVSPQNFRDATCTGSLGDSSDHVSSSVIECGSKVWAVWTGGDPGATATLTVTGTKTI